LLILAHPIPPRLPLACQWRFFLLSTKFAADVGVVLKTWKYFEDEIAEGLKRMI
jgi:hypothetical protein